MEYIINTPEEQFELIKQLISSPSRTKTQLMEIRSHVSRRIKEVARDLKYDLRPGAIVMVGGGRKLQDEEGEIVTVNRTRAVVRIEKFGKSQKWNVPFELLTVKEDA